MRELVRTAIRGLRRRRGVAATVVLTLAVGIGANSAVFSAVDAVLLKPLPYPDADRLVAVYELNQGLKQARQLVAPGRLEEWHAANRSFVGLAGSYFENVTDTTGATPVRVEAMRTSARFFSVLGVGAALGRTLTPEEERPGGPSVVVLSDAFWRARFNGDPAAIGQRLRLSGASRTIVGVMPPSFRYPTATTEAWIPAQLPPSLMNARRARFLRAIGRLKPGVGIEQAQDDLTAVQARLGEQYPATDKGWGASLAALKEEQIGGVRRSVWLLFGAVALVLMAACGNVACLLLAEATRREHEVAVRVALGASRAAVVRQLLAEGLAMAIAGATLGLTIAWWGVAWLRQQAVELPRIQDVTVDARLVAFTALVGILTTLAFALVPAIQTSNADPGGTLTRGGRALAGGRQRLQRVLVAAQMALAIVLLVGAGLLIRSFARLQQVSPGFDPEHVLTFRISASWNEAPAAVVGRQARTLDRLQRILGVESAAISQTMPAGADFPPGEFHIVGSDTETKTFADGRAVSAGYFKALRIPMLQGDTCNAAPAPVTSQVLVTRAFADRFFPGESAIGHALTSPGFPPGHQFDIVGVVGDVHEKGPGKAADPLIYWCGFSGFWPDPFYVVRLAENHGASLADIRAALLEIEPARALYSVRPLTESLSKALTERRLSTILLALFAATTVLLAAIGLYGVLSQLVAARRREIGVRMALGARAVHVLASVGGQAAAVVAGGIVVGLAGAFALARFMTTVVFGISAHDPLTFVVVPLVLVVVAGTAALIPAARAAAIDPMHALRDE